MLERAVETVFYSLVVSLTFGRVCSCSAEMEQAPVCTRSIAALLRKVEPATTFAHLPQTWVFAFTEAVEIGFG